MQNKPHKFSFEGRALEYFSLWLVNTILRVVTFGFYYPWAKTNLRKFFYGNTKLEGSSFSYHGNGMELFKGLLKAIAILILVAGFGLIIAFTASYITNNPIKRLPYLLTIIKIIWALFVTITPFLLFPFALHGSIRYLVQRLSWRGIYFNYHGALQDLIFIYFKYGFLVFIGFAFFVGLSDEGYNQRLTVLTPTLLLFFVAIFYTTFFVETRGYLFNNITWGNVEVRWYGDGVTFFMLRLRFLFPILLLIFYLHFQEASALMIPRLESMGEMYQLLIKIIVGILVFAITMILTYIWYLHGYLHYIFSNFRLFQGNDECEVWHESTFKDTLKTCLSVILLLFGALTFIGIINTVFSFMFGMWSGISVGSLEKFSFQNLQIMLLLQVLVFVIVMSIAIPFIIIFLMRWAVDGIRIDSKLDLDNLSQKQIGNSEGLGDNLSDIFNIDLV